MFGGVNLIPANHLCYSAKPAISKTNRKYEHKQRPEALSVRHFLFLSGGLQILADSVPLLFLVQSQKTAHTKGPHCTISLPAALNVDRSSRRVLERSQRLVWEFLS